MKGFGVSLIALASAAIGAAAAVYAVSVAGAVVWAAGSDGACALPWGHRRISDRRTDGGGYEKRGEDHSGGRGAAALRGLWMQPIVPCGNRRIGLWERESRADFVGMPAGRNRPGRAYPLPTGTQARN